MGNINPFGYDVATGQLRSISPNDTLRVTNVTSPTTLDLIATTATLALAATGANSITFTTNGVQRGYWYTDGRLMVEQTTANLYAVGITCFSPEITGDGRSVLTIGDATATGAEGVGAGFMFDGHTGSGGFYMAFTKGYKENSTVGNFLAAMDFGTRSGPTAAELTTKWRITSGGTFQGRTTGSHITWATDNSSDIGASGASRPRTGYFGTSVLVGATTILSGSVAATTGTLNLTTVASASVLVNTNSTARWEFTSAGHFITSSLSDNAYDIGASGATRPRTGYFGTSVVVGSTVTIGTASVTGSGALSLTATSATLALAATGANIITFTTNAAENMRVVSDGGIRLSNSSSAAVGAAGTAVLRVDGSGNLELSNNGGAFTDVSTSASPFTASGSDVLFSSASYNRIILHNATTGTGISASIKGADGTSGNAGNSIEIRGGAGSINGPGGPASLVGGNGGTGAGLGDGGEVLVSGGAGIGSASDGGDARVEGGQPTDASRTGGAVRFTTYGAAGSGTTATAVGKFVPGFGFQSKRTITPKTADYTVTEAEWRTVFTNEGTTAQRTFSLPTASAGMDFTFYVQDGDGLKVTAAAGDTIRMNTIVSAAGGNIVSSTIGNCVRLVSINATEWVAESYTGTADGSWAVT